VTNQVAIVGATGRMGRLFADVISGLPDFEVSAELDSSSELADMLGADIVVDVTSPAVSPDIVNFALANGMKVLVGTSGWSADRLEKLHKQVDETPGASVMVVPNFSLGSVVGTFLATVAAQFFESIEIVETHHVGKADSPSGTAIRTAEKIAAIKRESNGVIAPHANQSARGQLVDGVPVHSLRLHGVHAHQEVIFGGQSETLTISHDTHSHAAYRDGITHALKYLVTHDGLTVGLDKILGLEIESGADPADDAPSGTQ
jgi:4-hydroxy-tetrahydrodipicolinate reductase